MGGGDSNTRGPARELTGEAVKSHLREWHEQGTPAVPTSDLADGIDFSRKAVQKRLNELYEAGDVDRRPAGRGYIWWLPDDEQAGETDTDGIREQIIRETSVDEFPREKVTEIAANAPLDDFTAEKAAEVVQVADLSDVREETKAEWADELPPEHFSEERAQEIAEERVPEYSVLNYYERQQNTWNQVFVIGLLTMFVAVILSTLNPWNTPFGSYSYPKLLKEILDIVVVAGFSAAILAAGALILLHLLNGVATRTSLLSEEPDPGRDEPLFDFGR